MQNELSPALPPSPISVTQAPSRRAQGRWWILTIREASWNSQLPDGVSYIKGQLEEGTGGFRHFQLFVIFHTKQRLGGVKRLFGIDSLHAELTRSQAAEAYCWKEETRIGSPFELGTRPFRRNSREDWEEVWTKAKAGDLETISSEIRLCHYRTLRQIGSDYLRPIAMVRTAVVYWGNTGTGKTRRAWEELPSAYAKDPRTKFWCGYRGEEDVVLDEFRGAIDVSHLLRWLDRYPVILETKGGSTSLRANRFIITSNLHPNRWYPDLDSETLCALERRLNIIEMQ